MNDLLNIELRSDNLKMFDRDIDGDGVASCKEADGKPLPSTIGKVESDAECLGALSTDQVQRKEFTR